MAGKKRPKIENILPGISYSASNLVFPAELFVITPFYRKIFGHHTIVKKEFYVRLLSSPAYSLKYLLMWLKLGKDIQGVIDTLNKKRILNIEVLRYRIKIKNHPIVKLNLEGKRGVEDFRGTKVSDKYFLLWNEVLNDYLFYASEHTQQFLTAYQNTILPSYAKIDRKSSNRE